MNNALACELRKIEKELLAMKDLQLEFIVSCSFTKWNSLSPFALCNKLTSGYNKLNWTANTNFKFIYRYYLLKHGLNWDITPPPQDLEHLVHFSHRPHIAFDNFFFLFGITEFIDPSTVALYCIERSVVVVLVVFVRIEVDTPILVDSDLMISLSFFNFTTDSVTLATVLSTGIAAVVIVVILVGIVVVVVVVVTFEIESFFGINSVEYFEFLSRYFDFMREVNSDDFIRFGFETSLSSSFGWRLNDCHSSVACVWLLFFDDCCKWKRFRAALCSSHCLCT